MNNILVVDDDKLMSGALSSAIQSMGYEAQVAGTLKKGLEMAARGDFNVVILDVRLPDGNGLEALARFKECLSSPEVIILTGAGDPDGAELAIRSGAWSYITKPPTLNKIRLPVQRAVEYHRERMPNMPPLTLKRSGIIGESRAITSCLEQVGQTAVTEANVLITGETGTGKELFARAVHDNSPRTNGPFVVVDCTSLPEKLVESELFGHERGAFTGADAKHEGLVKQAHNGTLFLDEIGELPLTIQKAFLRVLQDRRFRPVGGTKEVSSDFRLVAATNRNLEHMVARGLFRQDLLFRLRTITLDLPPLRDREGDVKKLCRHFAAKFSRGKKPAARTSAEFLDAMAQYDWPGNVRELINALESSLSVAGDDPILFQRHLPTDIRVSLARSSLTAVHENREPEDHFILDPKNFPKLKDHRAEVLARIERRYLRELLSVADDDIREACSMSGLSRARLYALLKEYGLSRR